MDGIVMVSRRGDDRVVRGNQIEIRAQVVAHPLVDRALDEPQREGRRPRDPMRDLPHFVRERIVLKYLVDDANTLRLLGVDKLAGEEQLNRPRWSHEPRQEMRAARARHEPHAHIGFGKARPPRRVAAENGRALGRNNFQDRLEQKSL